MKEFRYMMLILGLIFLSLNLSPAAVQAGETDKFNIRVDWMYFCQQRHPAERIRLDLDWNDLEGASKYRLYCRKQGGTEWDILHSTGTIESKATFRVPADAGNVEFLVRAYEASTLIAESPIFAVDLAVNP